MQTALQPPTINTLSDHVIGCVMQRGWSSRYNCDTEYEVNQDIPPTRHQSSPAYCDIPKNMSVNPVSDFGEFPIQRQTVKRLGFERLESPGTRNPKRGRLTSTQRVASRREYNRCKQQKYRANQRNLIRELEVTIQQLPEEIENLKRRRYQLSLQGPRQLTLWIVATEYFRIFRNGIAIPGSMDSNDIEFLQVALSPLGLFDSVRGLEAHLENWNRFTQYFPDIRIDLKHMTQMTDHILNAHITATFTISDASMCRAFPHLFTSIEGTRCARVSALLRGQRLVLEGSVMFEWDDELNCVTSIQSQLDMMSSVLRILPELEDIILLFSKALIAPGRDIHSGLTAPFRV